MPYLDHAATTPMLPAAIEAMNSVFATVGNASSLHGSGRIARRRVEESRESIAADLGARPSEVVFTSGGTESDNLAVKGIYWARNAADPRRTRVLAGAVEHHAVLDAVEWLVEHEGASVTWLPVDQNAMVHPETLREELRKGADDVALITVMWANNEVGTIMPIHELASIAEEFGVPMHSDAVQAIGVLPVHFGSSGLSALSIAAHKFGGPQGAGALLLGRSIACEPLLHGGGQERDVRSGTPDTAGAVGMAAALTVAASERTHTASVVAELRDVFLAGVRDIDPNAVINGALGEHRLPGNAHITLPGCEGDSLLMLLDAAGVECSTGSACTAGVASASHVLLAMGMDAREARGSLRFSLGHNTTRSDIDAALAALPNVVDRARAAGMAGAGR